MVLLCGSFILSTFGLSETRCNSREKKVGQYLGSETCLSTAFKTKEPAVKYHLMG